MQQPRWDKTAVTWHLAQYKDVTMLFRLHELLLHISRNNGGTAVHLKQKLLGLRTQFIPDMNQSWQTYSESLRSPVHVL